MGARQKETINTRVIKYICVASTRTKLFYIFFLAKNKLKPLKNRALTGWWVVDTLARIKKSPIVGTNAKALLSVVVSFVDDGMGVEDENLYNYKVDSHHGFGWL